MWPDSTQRVSEAFVIDVCICTFQRPSLEQTLRSLASQRLAADMTFRIIVADNDETGTAQDLVSRICSETRLAFLYVHAPARNISIARNACLDSATADLIAFIDDDEEASPNWLQAMVDQIRARDLDVVFGPVRAVYGPDLKPWVQQADLHSSLPAFRASGEIDTGYTCNVMLRRTSLDGLQFDRALGRSGGEDTVFFSSMAKAGARLGFAPEGEVTEVVTPQRASLRWLLRRSFRSGQSHGRTLAGRHRRRQVAFAGAKAAYCLLLTGVKLPSPVGWRRAAVRGALHMGVITHLLGSKDLELY